MKSYIEVPPAFCNRLINHGPVILLSTRDENGAYNIAPIAWCSPVDKEPPMLLAVVGKDHKTYQNIAAVREFIMCVPHAGQLDLVWKTGKTSGSQVDKFDNFAIASFGGKHIDALIPQGCVGYLECSVRDIVDTAAVAIIIAEIVYAAADKEAFDQRLLTENPAGKTLHHLGGEIFTTPADEIIKAD